MIEDLNIGRFPPVPCVALLAIPLWSFQVATASPSAAEVAEGLSAPVFAFIHHLRLDETPPGACPRVVCVIHRASNKAKSIALPIDITLKIMKIYKFKIEHQKTSMEHFIIHVDSNVHCEGLLTPTRQLFTILNSHEGKYSSTSIAINYFQITHIIFTSY